jgi:hypothetical protein
LLVTLTSDPEAARATPVINPGSHGPLRHQVAAFRDAKVVRPPDSPPRRGHLALFPAQILTHSRADDGLHPPNCRVMQLSKFEFVTNLNTAKALGIKISDNLLSLADEVIE